MCVIIVKCNVDTGKVSCMTVVEVFDTIIGCSHQFRFKKRTCNCNFK